MKTINCSTLLLACLLYALSGYSQITQLTHGAYNYRSIVNNGRILISKLENNPNANLRAPDPENVTAEEMNAFMNQALQQMQQSVNTMEDPTQLLPLTLLQYDMRTRQHIELTPNSLHWTLAGPPDMDINGSSVWVENRGDQTQVILWNGVKEIQLTSNAAAIPGSPALGKATVEVIVAFPRAGDPGIAA
ncbi:MAG: hypothetical protein AAFU60_12115, partial [Bacteroidota bacterium]